MIHDPLHILIITDKEHMKFFFIALNGVDMYVAVAGIRLVKMSFRIIGSFFLMTGHVSKGGD